ncbi:uncharacterized protein LOC141537572 isoform X1 [Cotesia typhae]|uniref:uncharacterized protein LOC141537572 isoform X1 n=1 Tax=Cotesia typhae TaxID=2053667 RepID=UPI003D69E777
MLKTATVTRNVTIFAYILVIWVILIHHLPLWVAGIVPRTPTNLTDGSRALVMQTIYFYDETLTPTFEITATCQFMSSLVAGSSYTTIDCVFGALILHVSGQLQILEVKVQNLCDHYNKATQYVDKVIFQKDLNSVVRAHQRVILFVERMENIFCMMLLEQFTVFAIIFATEGFNVISVLTGDVESSFSTMSFSISYFIYALFLIFLYSAAGEYLIDCVIIKNDQLPI